LPIARLVCDVGNSGDGLTGLDLLRRSEAANAARHLRDRGQSRSTTFATEACHDNGFGFLDFRAGVFRDRVRHGLWHAVAAVRVAPAQFPSAATAIVRRRSARWIPARHGANTQPF